METTTLRLSPRLSNSSTSTSMKRSESFGRTKRIVKRPLSGCETPVCPSDTAEPSTAPTTTEPPAASSASDSPINLTNGQEIREIMSDVPQREKFNWDVYLRRHSLVAADETLFKNILVQPSQTFEVDDRLEGIDPQHESLFCVLHVVKCVGHRVRLRFDGYSAAADFWTNTNSPFLFPAGWCLRNNVSLQPPRGYSMDSFNWEQYLAKHKYRAAPEECFVTSKCQKSEIHHGFKKGMKLEAIDRKNPAMICIATVADVLPNHILLHFDGWDNIYDQWVGPDSQLIFPAGSAKLLNQALSLPQSLSQFFKNGEFTWPEYLEAFDAQVAPEHLFKGKARNSPQYVVGSQVEAVDRRVPQIIRVATIAQVDVAGGILTLQYNGWIEQYNIQCEMDSPEVYPPGYCERTGHPLEPPTDEEYLPPYADGGLCPIQGCRGIGHAKGPMYSKHQTVASCPYSEENFQQDCGQYERLEELNGVACKKRPSAPQPPQIIISQATPFPRAPSLGSETHPQSSCRKRPSTGHHSHPVSEASSARDGDPDDDSLTPPSSIASFNGCSVSHNPPKLMKRQSRASGNTPAKQLDANGTLPAIDHLPVMNGIIPLQEKSLPPAQLPSNLTVSHSICQPSGDNKPRVYPHSFQMQSNVQLPCPISSSVFTPNSMFSLVPQPHLEPSGMRLHQILVEELFPKEMWAHLSRQLVLSWSVFEVAEFVTKMVQLSAASAMQPIESGEALRQRIMESEIDGESMLLLQTSDFLNFFKLPLGIVVKIMAILAYVKSC